MGARESKPGGGNGDQAIVDYYQLLEVDEDATSDEIKACIIICIRHLPGSESASAFLS